MKTNRLRWYGGYTFGWKSAIEPYAGYCWGCNLTPKFLERAARDDIERPVLVDNGAFPAWRDGRRLEYDEQVEKLKRGHRLFRGHRVTLILPDVLGDGVATIQRVRKFLRAEEVPGNPSKLMPVQEGMLEMTDEFPEAVDGFFVGGESIAWKREAVQVLKRLGKWVHVGKISKRGHLRDIAYSGADSFDTTTFLQEKGRDYTGRIRRYCEPFNGSKVR